MQDNDVCNWHNVNDGTDQYDWTVVTGAVDRDLWLTQTSSDRIPR
jgi:hypothetical protein